MEQFRATKETLDTLNFKKKTNNAIVLVSTVKLNKHLTNDFVQLMMLWTTGPWTHYD